MNSHIDEHIIEAAGRCRVVVRDGKVVEVGRPLITDCPLARRFAYPVTEMKPEAIKKNVQNRIDDFGMCTPHRQLTSQEVFVGFGASEIVSTSLKSRFIDAAVMACDGAGTVIVTRPDMAQGIGGRMSGLVSTTPIPEVIKRIEEDGGMVADPVHASLDPLTGVHLAKKAGLEHLVVTISNPEDARSVREYDPDAIIIAVHTTGYSEYDAQVVRAYADIVTACASKTVRDICGPHALLQAGSAIPVYALTPSGKHLLILRMAAIHDPLYVVHSDLPVRGEKGPSPLI
jgi:putative methanogenesis marker protein 8